MDRCYRVVTGERHPNPHWQTRRVAPSRRLGPRGVLAAAAAALSALHLLVADSRAADWRLEGAALMGIGVITGVLSVAVLVSAARWPVAGLGAVAVLPVVGIMWTRLGGYPIGSFADYSPRLTVYDVVILCIALLVTSVAGAALIVGVGHLGPPGFRFDTVAPIIVVLAALPGFGLSSWTERATTITGAAHTHGVVTVTGSSNSTGLATADPLTSADRVRLGAQMESARSTALLYPTLADAERAGWIPIGDFVPGAGQMLVDPTPIDAFDPAMPSALLFASSAADAPVVGVQYDVWGDDAPDGFVGQGPLWHLHAGTCEIDDERGTFTVVYEPAVTGTACGDIDARLTTTVSWMIRAWVIPGWDNPGGPFAHDHSLLTQPQ